MNLQTKAYVRPHSCSSLASSRLRNSSTKRSVRPIGVSANGLKECLHADRSLLVIVVYSTAVLSLITLLLYLSFFAAQMERTSGIDFSQPEFLSCRSWGFGTSCGLWGVDCRPFETDWTAFRCPSRCSLDQSSSLAVYGSGPYRADSRICRAAIHSGVIGHNGGCALYRFAGSADSFEGSTSNGVTTKDFLSWFPKTIEFRPAASSFCTDLSWVIVSISFLTLSGYALFPKMPPVIAFHVLIAWGFFYVRIIGQPRSVDYTGIVLRLFGEVFILLAATSLLYRWSAAHTFLFWRTMTARRRLVLWGGCYVLPYHFLLHLNMVAYVPWLNVDLGGYENLSVNAGTYIFYGILGTVCLCCLVYLLRKIYKESRWRQILFLYSAVVFVVLLSWALFPSSNFHFHHTMIGAFVVPITRFSTPVAAVTQSAAFGVFVQGYAAWGWSSYLETVPTYLTIAVPQNVPVVGSVTSTSAYIGWETLDGTDGYSLRLNTIEVYRGVDNATFINKLHSNTTYFVSVAGIADWGINGRVGPSANFTTTVA